MGRSTGAYEMTTIWKFPVPIKTDKPFTVAMPNASELLHVGTLGEENSDNLFLWALVHTDMDYTERTFQWFGTGWTWPEDNLLRQHVGSVVVDDFARQTSFVWHLFE